jgi:3',5'-cyclic-AMP phosphodiesterase
MLTFVHLSDTHIHADPTFTGSIVPFTSRSRVKHLIDRINSLPFAVDFVLHTGDIMTDPEDPQAYATARRILNQLKPPVYYIPGNHDRTEWVQRVLMERETVQANLDYSFVHKGVQFVCLDSSQPETAVGHLAPEQLAWLDRQLDSDDQRHLVVAVHHHPLPSGAPWLDHIVLENGIELHQRLLDVRHRLRGVFYGHIHESMVTVRDGISYYSVPSGWFQTQTWPDQEEPTGDPNSQPGFNLVTLTETDTFIRQYRLLIPG